MYDRIARLGQSRVGVCIIGCTLLPLGLGTVAMAQESRQPSAAEIVQELTPTAESHVGTRGLGNRGISVEGRAERVQSQPSLNLEVNFEYASPKLTPDARIVLDNLGQALNDPVLRESRMRIAGHTDARGTDAYNLVLSRQRAQSVADYLVRQHGVNSERLSVEGFGRSQLLDPANPESAVNRRVQVVNLGN